MPYPLTPLSTEPAEWYKIGQKATDAAKYVEQIKDADGDRHEWISDTALTTGPGAVTPPPVASTTSTDPTAYLAANQGKILSDADISAFSLLGQVLTITRKDGTTLTATLPVTALDGNDKPVIRTNSTANIAPTATEVPTPIAGDTAKVVLADKSIEFWSYNGTAWAKDTTLSYLTAAVYDAVYGTIGTTSPAGTVNAVANWGYLADGTPLLTDRIYFASAAGNVNKTVTVANLKALLAAPDEIVDVSGVTFPVTFPITTLPGTPVFAPATPTSTTAVYKIVTGANVAYAAWNGTQYISAPAPVAPVLDGNDKHVLRANATSSVAPTVLEVPTPISGDTAKIKLSDGSIEYWTFTTAWTRDFVDVPTAISATTVSNTIAGVGATRTISTTVNGVVGTPVAIPDLNDNVLTIGGTAAAPTISNGAAAVALPAVPPTTNTLAITKAAGAVSTVQGVAAIQAIPAGTIVESIGYNAAGAPVYQAIVAPVAQTSDNGLTKTINNTQLGGALITPTTITTTAANTLAIAGLVANPVPTDIVTRDAAGKLTQSPLAAFVSNVRYGLVLPAVLATDKKGDTYIQNSTGTAAGLNPTEYVFDGTVWYKLSGTEDEINVTGATFPITFPVTTIPGTPVFAPATPADATKLYSITDGTQVVYAKWNGTQYISAPAPTTPNVRYGLAAPTVIAGTDKKNDTYIQTSDGTSAGLVTAEWVFDGTIWKNVTPSADYFSNVVASANTVGAPNGTNDLTEAIRREGFTGFGVNPTVQLATTSLATSAVNVTAAAYTTTNLSHTIRLTAATAQSVTFHSPAPVDGQILEIVNASGISKTTTGYLKLDGTLGTTISPYSTVVIQSVGGSWSAIEQPADQLKTRFAPNDTLDGVAVGGNIPAQAQQFIVFDGNFANPLTLPPINQFSELLTISSSAGLATNIATTNQIAGAVSQTLVSGGSITFAPGPSGWMELNATVINGHTEYAVRGTYAAPLTGAITVNPIDELLIVATGSTTTLPSPATFARRQLNIKKPGVGSVAITGSIDGVTNLTLANVNESVTLRSDGATWVRI